MPCPTPTTSTSLLTRAGEGATPELLVMSLKEEGLSSDAARAYVDRLIAEQVLVADFGMTVTGPEPLEPLIEQLRKSDSTEPVGDRLDEVGAALAEIDGAGVGAAPERYRAIFRSLEDLPAEVEMPRLFQVDMVKPAPAATLSAELVDEIERGIRILHRLGGVASEDELDRFRAEFQRRYEGRAVPLVEALDGEAGIGFGRGAEPAPLLRRLVFPATSDERAPWGRRHKVLLTKLIQATAKGAQEIVLSRRDIEDMAGDVQAPLPLSLAAMATVAASSDEALDRGAFQVHLRGAGGPSGARLLGRFCHADPVLREDVGRYLKAEEALDPEAVFAEIVHLPEGGIGNILLRPVLRGYEIPYLGRSGAPRTRQIPVTDLLVSLRGGRIVLTSERLSRRVIPRLTSAHDFSRRSVPLYRFLCALQAEGVAEDLMWTWGVLGTAPFLPRVRFGRLVLSLATWRVATEELRRLGAKSDAALFRDVQAWRTERKLPRYVVLADYDNALLVDLDNLLSVESFVHLVRRRDEATLEEFFPPPGRLCARGPEGSFVHELVVPFAVAKPAPPEKEKRLPAIVATGFRRTFAPGSEWLYANLYMGEATADAALRDVVAPLRKKVMNAGAADRWFFIRYGDPDYHLRLRFHGEPARLRDEVGPDLAAAIASLLDDGRVRRLGFDTYEREVERYGGPEGMLLAEELFHADSDAVIEIVRGLERGDEGGRERWQLALRGMDMLLSDLGFGTGIKLDVIRKVRASFAAGHRLDGALGRQIGERFRRQRPALEDLIDPVTDETSPLEPGFAILRARSERNAPLVAELRALAGAGRLSMGLEGLAPSYVHLHANRMLRSAQRAQELVLYSFLVRLYEAQVRRDSAGDTEETSPS
ncbi:MAG: lantibiotic dehydratase [Actinomycetota bacterium]